MKDTQEEKMVQILKEHIKHNVAQTLKELEEMDTIHEIIDKIPVGFFICPACVNWEETEDCKDCEVCWEHGKKKFLERINAEDGTH